MSHLLQSNLSKSSEVANQYTKPSTYPQHRQISSTIFLCVNNTISDDSNREIIDISDDDDEEVKDENTCKNGTSIDDSSDEEEIEVIQLSDDDGDEDDGEDEVNDELSNLVLDKHNKINQFQNDFNESSLDLTTLMQRQQQSTDFENPSGPSTCQTVHHQPLLCPDLEEDNSSDNDFRRCSILKTLGFYCSECSEFIDTRPKLDKHLLEVHDKLPFKCMVRGCNGQFAKRLLLSKHYIVHSMHNTRWICSAVNCNYQTSIRDIFVEHVKCHQKCLFQCAQCPMQFSRRHMVYNHHKSKHKRPQRKTRITKTKRFQCTWPQCGAIYSYHARAIGHVRSVHLTMQITLQEAIQRNVECYRVPNEFIREIPLIGMAQESRNRRG